MKTEGTNLLLLTISAFWSSSRWPKAMCFEQYQVTPYGVTRPQRVNEIPHVPQLCPIAW